MTKILSIGEVQQKLPGLLALAGDDDEIIIEENGEPVATVLPIHKIASPKKRTAGLGKDTIWMSDDFDAELPDEFWGFDKEV